jgi:hypothetical protein
MWELAFGQRLKTTVQSISRPRGPLPDTEPSKQDNCFWASWRFALFSPGERVPSWNRIESVVSV